MPRSKKDIDKELMYKRLLPTSAAIEEESKELKAAEQLLTEPVAPPELTAEPPKPPAAPATAPAVPAPAEAPPRSNAASAPAPAPAPAAGKKLPQPVNLMEAFVETRIDEAMARFNCCGCEKCRKDVMALTLNKLQPFYVIEEDVNLRDEKEKERAAEVATALVQAILVVKSNPSH